MKRDVQIIDHKVVVRPRPDDVVAKVRALKLRERVAAGQKLTDTERDIALLALLEISGVLP